MRKIIGYFKGVGQEARRVRWPHKKQLWTSVGVVSIITVLSALIIYFEDMLTANIWKGFESAFPSSSGSASGSNSIVSAAQAALIVFGGLLK